MVKYGKILMRLCLLFLFCLLRPQISAADGELVLRAGGVEVALSSEWTPLVQPSTFFVQKRAQNAARGIALSMGSVKFNMSVQQYAAISAASLLTGTEAQLDYIAKVINLPRSEVDKALASTVGKQVFDQVKEVSRSMRFELLGVTSLEIPGGTRYEFHSTITKLDSGEVIHSRQFLLHGESPGEIVTITYACTSDDVFKQRNLANSIRPATHPEDDSIGYFYSGTVKGQKGDLAGAITDFTKAISINPNYAEAYNARGKANAALAKTPKDTIDAEADYTKAIEINASFAEAYFNRAVVRQVQGEKSAALFDHNKAIELKPDYAQAYSHRGSVKAASRDYKGAMIDYNKAIELQPKNALPFRSRGLLKQVQGDANGAIADYSEAIKLKPDDAISYEARGNLRKSKGDVKGAQADFSKATELKRR